MAIIQVDRKKPYKVVIRVYNRQITKSFLRKIDAQAWEREMLHRRDAGGVVGISAKRLVVTLTELRERFMREYAEHRQAPSTRLMESALYDTYVKPTLGSADIRKLKRADFSDLMNRLASTTDLGSSRLNRIRSILSCMYNQAIHWELVETNPVLGVKKLPERNFAKEEVIQYLTQAEVDTLLGWLKVNDTWLYPMVRTLVNLGLRFGEMAALRPQDVVQGGQGSYLQVSRTYCRHSQAVRNRTKGGRSRMLPLGPGMAELLGRLSAGKGQDSPLFWESWDECKHQTKFRKRFLRALKESGVRKVRPHDLRHTFAVHFLESGGHLYDLQKLLGHQSLRLTERYSHFSRAMSERARGLVDHG